MKMVKMKEQVIRTFTDGEGTERIDNVTYELRNAGGIRIGETTVYSGGGYNVTVNGTAAGMDAAVAEIKAMFGITEEE